ncbi:MAG: hypothetical protein IJS09_06335 [Treponema sp.]|nr:hypothetical protein [Treponema sp.]
MAQKRLLCFGDSNTWGYIPGKETLTRYGEDIRWTSLLQKKLGDEYRIIEFGLCGCESGAKFEDRALVDAQPVYPSVLFASLPVDAVLIMLGTNDLKKRNEWKSGDTAKNVDTLINVTHTFAPDAKIFLAPAVILQKGLENDPDFDPTVAIEDSKRCAEEIAELAEKRKIPLFDTNKYVHELDYDGCHFTAGAHKAFAEALAQFLSIHF